MDRIETTILQNLIYNEEYSRKVIPFIKSDYFENKSERVTFEQISEFIVKYGSAITIEALNIEVDNRTDLTETEVKEIRELNGFLTNTPVDYQWLMDTTEKWCRDRAIYLALMESIQLADGDESKKNKDAIPSILSDALAVSFDNHVGHDYLEDYEERYELYHKKEDKIQLTSNFSTRLQRVGFQIKHSILLSLALVLVSLCLCVMSQAVCYSKTRTYYTSRLRWLRRKLLKELMLIF